MSAFILVVDDEAPIRRMLRQLLEHAGYVVLEAEDGQVALAVWEEHPVDLVITDLLMPEREGLETIMELRRRSSEVPIIAMSGGGRYGMTQFLSIAQQLGAERIFTKPFDAQEVLEAVSELLKTRSEQG